jgi:DNA (cytosine-5)-methyltransferase 1
VNGLTALDLFCGAGGSSTGMAAAGVHVVMAANHWQLAVDVHQANHPTTDHDVADISAVDPRRYPTTDILWASPECTNHSGASGKRRVTGQGALWGDEPDPGAERSRATMWDVPRFTEAMIMRGRPYEFIVVENVVDAALWMFWDAWLAAMHAAGYDHHVVYLNSAFAHGRDYGWYGAPQYRDRIYVVFWRRGAPVPDLDIRPPAWCPRCEAMVEAVQAWKKPYEPWGRYRAQYVYQCPDVTCRAEVEPLALPAAVAIDWTDLGGRIGDRKRPLALATRERIRAGLARYGRALVTPAGGTWNDHAVPVDVPMRTRTTRETDGLACPPLIVPTESRDGLRARPAGEPKRTQTGRQLDALTVPLPFLALLRSGRPRTVGIGEPLATVVANGSNHALAVPEPFVTLLWNNCDAAPVGAPLATVVTAGNHHALTVPDGFVMRNNNSSRGGDGSEMCTPFGEPVRTVTTKGHQSLVTAPDALLVPYYGTAVAHPVSEPAGTVTTRDRHALVTRAPGDVTDDEVDACTFRMLEPTEIGVAMAFPPDYLMSGPKRDRVRMYGNAVTPPAARLILERLLAAHGMTQ